MVSDTIAIQINDDREEDVEDGSVQQLYCEAEKVYMEDIKEENRITDLITAEMKTKHKTIWKLFEFITAKTGAGGLFGGGGTTAPSFSFAPIGNTPASGGTGLALTPYGGGAQMQLPTLGGSPYGALPEAPRVNPLPEYKVGLTQRILAPPSAGPPRHVALITPRSLTPHGGGKIRPRRGATASRMSRNPAEFLAAAAGAGGGPTNYLGLGGNTPNGAGTPGSTAGTPNGGSSNLFVPRDNPRKLFIRDTLPSTSAAGGVSVIPAMGGTTPGHALRTPGSGLRITPGTRGTRDTITPNGENGGGFGRGMYENCGETF